MSKTVSYTNVHLSYTADLQGLRQAKSDMAAMNRVINQTKTDTQKYEEHVQKLDRLLHNGKITQEQYTAAIAAAQTKFKQAAQEAEKVAKAQAKVNLSTEQAVRAYTELGNAQNRLKSIGMTSGAGKGSMFAGIPGLSAYTGAAGVGLLGYGAFSQAKQAVQAYGDLEATLTTLAVVYGDAAKANRDFEKMRAMAAVSPLQTKDFTQAAQVMAQYGIEVENVIGHLSRVSEVAAGNSERMHSLSLAFGQVKANGRLMGQEVLQMVNAGFNPLAEISRTTGRSMQDLRKDMENGLITFEMVADAFRTATEEGGRFNDMNEKLGKTVNAQIAQMRDEVTKTYEAFGEMLTKGGVNSALSETSQYLKNIQGSVQALKDIGGLKFLSINATGGVKFGAGYERFGMGPNSQAEIERMASEEAAFNAAREKMGGIIGSAISSIPSQIESAGMSYADSMRSMTDVLRQHSQEITQTTVKQRAAEIERIKREQAEKQQATKAAGADSAINTELPKAISMATKEGYEYVRNAQQSAQQKQLEEQRRQRQAQEEANKILEQIKNKPAMGIVK